MSAQDNPSFSGTPVPEPVPSFPNLPPRPDAGPTLYRAADEAMACPLGEGIALLDTRSNLYFSLDPVGTVVWEMLAAATGVDALAAEVAREFDVAADTCRADVEALLDELRENDLVRAT